MVNVFLISFYGLSAICAIVFLYTRQAVKTCTDAAFLHFQRIYLVVYVLAMGGDWLQGPYVYALYANYGIKKHEIEILFVAGFGSSMIFGTFVGSFADRYGRRNNCLLYGILYGMSCITKHFNNFWVLMFGRFLGGIATSILYSAFESWLINEHNKRGFAQELQGTIFSHAVLANSLVAIVAGVLAQHAVDYINFVAPFDVSLCVLVAMCVILMFTWNENYGDTTVSVKGSISKSIKTITTDHKVLCLGVIQSLFEGSMYCFVLEWTPALTPHRPEVTNTDPGVPTIPHGYIFASFMVAVMLGSSAFKILTQYFAIESFMRGVFLVSAVCLALPIVLPKYQLTVFFGFLVFEVCVGIFWPSMGTMRGRYVPEDTRATIMNVFRIPLNLVVVVILIQNLSLSTVFTCCVIFLLISAACQHWLYLLSLSLSKTDLNPEEIEEDDNQALLESDKSFKIEVDTDADADECTKTTPI